MSRCLPFSAEAYGNRGLNREALVKLHKENDEKSERSKEIELRRKHKKEHKHKEKKRRKINDGDKTKNLTDEKKKKDKQHKIKSCLNVGSPSESLGYKYEQLEKSDITVEHDLPSCSGSTCNYPDRVDNNKRKRQEDIDRRKNVFRIAVPSKKHNEPCALTTEQRSSCPTEGSEACNQRRTEKYSCAAETHSKPVAHEQLSQKSCPKLPLSTTERTKTKSSKRSKAILSYKTLIEVWVPNFPGCDQFEQHENDNEDWLFVTKSRPHGQEPKRHKAENPAFWPQVMQLLEDDDVFALPYTVLY